MPFLRIKIGGLTIVGSWYSFIIVIITIITRHFWAFPPIATDVTVAWSVQSMYVYVCIIITATSQSKMLAEFVFYAAGVCLNCGFIFFVNNSKYFVPGFKFLIFFYYNVLCYRQCELLLEMAAWQSSMIKWMGEWWRKYFSIFNMKVTAFATYRKCSVELLCHSSADTFLRDKNYRVLWRDINIVWLLQW